MKEEAFFLLAVLVLGPIGFFPLYMLARRLRACILILIWGAAMALFLLSAELHMLSENANSWDFALAVIYQSIPLMIGGTLAISEEPLGGSPTGAPTGPVLATGEIRGV